MKDNAFHRLLRIALVGSEKQVVVCRSRMRLPYRWRIRARCDTCADGGNSSQRQHQARTHHLQVICSHFLQHSTLVRFRLFKSIILDIHLLLWHNGKV